MKQGSESVLRLQPQRFRRESGEQREQLRSVETDKLHERCAVFGMYNAKQQAAPSVYLGLSALQHRGQETSGIVASDTKTLSEHKGPGLVSQVYTQEDINALSGTIAVGHNRYSTNGGSDEHVQPVTSQQHLVAAVHNGTLPETKKLEAFLTERNIHIQGLNDSELMQRALEYHVSQGMSLEEAVKSSYSLFTGAFALIAMTKDKLVGVRDGFGIRPLSLGQTNDGYVLSSETCAIDTIGGKTLRDVKAGEMVIIDTNGVRSEQIVDGQEKLDIFEIVYFSRPDSKLYGKSVNEMRREMGRELAREKTIEADMVISVPNSAIPAAAGYAEESGICYEPDALMKDSYTHRTFINPSAESRAVNIRRKFTPIAETLTGKRVVVIDDSIVRGPTSKELVKMLWDNGAAEVHFVVASPPIKYPDFYGIATPTQEELIASRMSIDEIKEYIGADSLQYLSYDGLIRATGFPEDRFNTSCFTGVYPIDIGDNAKQIDFTV